MTYFEKVREERIETKIKNSTKIATGLIAINLITLLCTMMIWHIFLVFFIASVLFTARQLKIIENGKKYKSGIKNTPLYNELLKYNISYDEILNELSEEMSSDIVIKNNFVYITKNWIIDFHNIDIKIISLDQIIWIYRVVLQSAQYVKCHLEDGSEYVLANANANTVIEFIHQQRPTIFRGYSNKIEALMEENKEQFIQNIKNGIYPTVEGTWEIKNS